MEIEEPFKTWEENHKKSMLTFWILLIADADEPVAIPALGLKMAAFSTMTITMDTQSLYRALRRLNDQGLLAAIEVESPRGPNRKLFKTTKEGKRLLARFTNRNILPFFRSDIKRQIETYRYEPLKP
jgi:DNA-binding PadR family transcriptional regulator